ncbi:MAG: hypothetical protein M3Q06_14455, partial [Bacteroidota bacterium]|nr:hypothetical protein [Bacteroidota bacterium]
MKTFRINSRYFRLRNLLLSALALLALSFLTAWFFNSSISVSQQQKSLQRYIAIQQQDAKRLLSDTALMRRLIQNTASQEEFQEIARKNYGLFIFRETYYENEGPVFWNTQRFAPPTPDFTVTQNTSFRQFFYSYFVVHEQKLELPGNSNNIVAYVMIPVVQGFRVTSAEAGLGFVHDRDAIKKIAIADGRTNYPIISADGSPLFYITQAEETISHSSDMVTTVLRLTAFVILLVAIHFLAVTVLRKRGHVAGILFLGLVLLLIRFALFYFPELLSLRNFELFDPSVYGSNFLNRSLGDLLINAVLLCWLVLFAWNYLGPIKKLPSLLRGRQMVVIGVLGVIVLVLVTFQLATIVHNLVVSSKISFKVTDVSRLGVFTGFSFLILALLSLTYYYFSRMLFRTVLMAIPNLLYLYFVVALAGLASLSLYSSSFNYSYVLFQLPVLLWLVGYTLILTQEQAIINRFRITIAGILFWVFLFSVSLAALIMSGNRSRELRELKDIAEKYEELREPTKAMALSAAMHNVDNRYLNNNLHRFYNKQVSEYLRDSIASSRLTSSYSQYKMRIYLFDSAGRGINNPDGSTYADLDNIYTVQSKPTGPGDLLYYETSFSDFVFILKREILDSTVRKGTFFLLARPRNFTEQSELTTDFFRRGKNEQRFTPSIMALYRNGKLADYIGNYAFPVTLNPRHVPASQLAMIEKDDYNELWYKGASKKIIVVVSKKESFIESITLFSYLFCSFLVMIGVIRLFELAAHITRTWPRIEIFTRLNIRSQIQATIIFISILSFLIIGIATIAYFRQRNERTTNEQLTHQASTAMKEIQEIVG